MPKTRVAGTQLSRRTRHFARRHCRLGALEAGQHQARHAAQRQLNLNFQNTVRAISSRIDLSTNAEDFASRLDHDNSSLASAAAFDNYGVYMFVALETSREVAGCRRARALGDLPLQRRPRAPGLWRFRRTD